MKINFNKIKFKNFLCFGSRTQEVELKNGLNMVIGIDKDNDERSNGSGKTSLLETIPFALYGTTHKPIKKSDIINWKNKKNCEVVLDFNRNDDRYTILRGIKPNVLEVYKNNVIIDRPPHVRDYQKIIDDIIGLNFQSFISIIHSNINSSMPITVMNKPEKRKFMEKIFNLKVYSILNEKCNEKLKKLNDKRISLEKDQEFSFNSIDILTDEIKVLEKRQDLYDKKNAYEKAKNEYKEKSKEFNKLKQSFEKLNIKLSDISLISSKLKSTIQKIRMKNRLVNSKIRNINIQINKLNEELKKSDEVVKYKEKLDYIIKKYGDIDKLEKYLIELSEKIKITRDSIDKLQIEREDIQRVLITFNSKQNELSTKISSLENHNICPLCEQEVKGEINIVDNWKNELFGLERHIKECESEKLEVDVKIKSLKSNIEKLEKNTNNYQQIKDGLSRLKLKIADYNINENESMIKIYGYKKKKYKNVINKLNLLHDNIVKKYNKKEEKIDLIIKEKNNIELKINEIEKLEKNIEILEREMKIEEKIRSDIKNEIKEKTNKLKKLKDKQISIESMLISNRNTSDYLSFIKDLCRDENIKQFAISSNIPYINERVNYYLSQVGHNFYVLLDNWLNLVIKGPGITNGSYGSLSAGESKCIDLAMQFAFLDVSRIQSSSFIDLLIEDEILDSSIDSIGLPKLLNILKFKQREDNLKTFIISHRSEIDKEYVDNIYQVVKTNGYSTVNII